MEREKEKYAALVSYDPKRTDKVVAEQQAANMRLAQLEERREEAQRPGRLGGSDLPSDPGENRRR